MIKHFFLLGALSLPAAAALAQTPCENPVASMKADGKTLTALPVKLPATLQIQLSPAPKCPTAEFTATKFEIVLVRGKSPQSSLTTVEGSSFNLAEYAKIAKVGDKVFLEVKEYDVKSGATKEHKQAKDLIITLPIK